MFVMGTAGHVDHGKSTLVKVLTGIDPDRLPEEKERGLTIDLGFAWMTTPSGRSIGIVDVPGHERFIRNMIAGVGAIDFVLLVIAADDGWMPQTSEHLAILEYMGIECGIVALTKCDTVERDWLYLVQTDIAARLKPSALESAPIVPVDSISGHGLDDLRAAIDALAGSLSPRRDIGRPRLYIDRVFAMTGRGVVVTGTLIDGALQAGQQITIAPESFGARIRDLQIHKQSVARAQAGHRVAVNLSGVERAQMRRGQCLVANDDTDTYDRLWADVSVWADSVSPLETGRQVLVLLGTSETEASAFPLDTEQIAPGSVALCELRLKEAITVRLLDHFVLRWPTPQVTVGGGTVLDLGGDKRMRRQERFIAGLQRRRDRSLMTFLETDLQRMGYVAHNEVLRTGLWTRDQIAQGLDDLIAAGAVQDHGGLLFWSQQFGTWSDAMKQTLADTLAQHPYLPGLNLSEWANRARVPAPAAEKIASAMLASGAAKRNAEVFSLSGHQQALPREWAGDESRLWQSLCDGGAQPPTRPDLEAQSPHARAIIQYWIDTGRVINLSDGVIFPSESFDAIRQQVIGALQSEGALTAGTLRDLLGTTRKYAVPIGEQLDREGLTRREGDTRVLVRCEGVSR
ncbi:MAG TPA: selenocysteine-specific translation elongation factor [candidate division Zixibacteria bacterium]